MKIGDILVAKWGWEQTNATFFKVTKVGKQATLQRLHTVNDWKDGWMIGVATPGGAIEDEKPIRRKIQNYGNGDYVKVESYMYARPWDGKPENVTGYA